MRKVTLFIAMSLDGYIADVNGKVDWLTGEGDNDTTDTYAEFVRDVDTVIMGRKTYHQIVTELSPDTWVYDDLTTYVVTHRPLASTDKIRFVNDSPVDLVKRLRAGSGAGIWICGGAELIRPLVEADLIDSYDITVIPTILGSGIRLFGHADHEIKLALKKTRSFNGMTELIYQRRKPFQRQTAEVNEIRSLSEKRLAPK